MHAGNRDFLAYCRKTYPGHFAGARVLELGSYDANGSARAYFPDAARYVGVDREAGPGVDLVSEAKATAFLEGEFDTLVCVSVFEHDPDWRSTLAHNVPWLRPGALVILSWGAEGNLHHAPEPWKPVPAAEVLAEATRSGLVLVEHFPEAARFTPDCAGAYDAVARKP